MQQSKPPRQHRTTPWGVTGTLLSLSVGLSLMTGCTPELKTSTSNELRISDSYRKSKGKDGEDRYIRAVRVEIDNRHLDYKFGGTGETIVRKIPLIKDTKTEMVFTAYFSETETVEYRHPTELKMDELKDINVTFSKAENGSVKWKVKEKVRAFR